MHTSLATSELVRLPPRLLAGHLSGSLTTPVKCRPLVLAWTVERYVEQLEWEAELRGMQFQQSHLTHYAGMIAEHHAAGIWTTSLVEQLASNLGGWARGTCGKISGSNKVDLSQLQSAVRLTVRRDHQFISIQIDAARALHHTRLHCELAAIFSEIDQALIDGDGGMTLMEPRITMSKYVMLSECNLDEVAARTDRAKKLLSEAGWLVGS